MLPRFLILSLTVLAFLAVEGRQTAEAALVFNDEFEGTELEEDWLWRNPGVTSTYDIADGAFSLSVDRGQDQWLGVNKAPRILREETKRPWTIETRITGMDGNSSTHVGLFLYKGPKNFVIWGWLGNQSLEASGSIDGQWINPVAVMDTKYEYLRIRRVSNSYYFDASSDGVHWTNANVFTSKSLSGVQVGVIGKDWNSGSGTSYTATFEYFRQYDRNLTPPLIKGTPTTRKIAQETGAASINDTDEVDVCMADYGIMFDWRSRTNIAFGDTGGCGSFPTWRSNTLAESTDTTPANGLAFSQSITGTDGNVKELFREDVGGSTALPTAAIGIGSNAYMFYMNIASWGSPGSWSCNQSSIASATSTNPGTWTKRSDTIKWSTGNFNQVAVWKDGTMLYFWGIPCGRFGSVKLMRVPEANILTKSAYRYFIGYTNGEPAWSADESRAVTVAGGPVGELSVRYNAYLDRLTMTYLDERKGAIVLREAPDPWGPWGAPVVLATGSTYPQLYGAFTKQGFERENGKIFYFMMSQFGPYNSYWMETTLP